MTRTQLAAFGIAVVLLLTALSACPALGPAATIAIGAVATITSAALIRRRR